MAVGAPSVHRSPFGRLGTGEAVERFTIAAGALEMDVITYGARIQALRVPDAAGRAGDVVLGYADLARYEDDPAYHGAVCGRVANRIRHGTFTLDGVTYRLTLNHGRHHLHGGARGFSHRIWEAEPFATDRAAGVVLRYTSPDGEEGYPGTLHAQVTYTLRDDGALAVAFAAESDRPTPVNLVQHAWFNLAGEGSGDILDHELAIRASSFTVFDEELIPTGELRPVAGTPLDFREPRRIGERIRADDPLLRIAGGYDHNYVFDEPGSTDRPAVRLRDPGSGRVLEVFTSEPGLQLFTGNFPGDRPGKCGRPYPIHAGVCLETQHFPDSPNHSHFPSTIVRPGERCASWTTFVFGVDR